MEQKERAMKCPGKSSKAFSAGGLVVLLVLAFAGQAFGQKKPKFAYVANDGSSNVSAYTINSTTGALSPVTGSPFAAGSFPFSVAVDPTGKFAYVANACGVTCTVSGNVSAYTIDSTTGALSPVPGSPFAAGSFPISVAVDPSGKFAYVVDFFGGVSAYTINSTTGALSPVPGSPFAAGSGPRSVAVVPSGKFAYVTNQCGNVFCSVSGSVSAYTIDSTTGALSPVPGSPFAAGTFPLSVAIAGQSTVPFAAFTLKAEISLGLPGAFEVKGNFTLVAGSNGINPLTEDVKLQVGTFSTTIPASSFQQDPRGRFKFEGVISGVSLEVQIASLGGNDFQFKAEAQGADLSGTVNPVTVELTIGDDGGSTTVTAEFD